MGPFGPVSTIFDFPATSRCTWSSTSAFAGPIGIDHVVLPVLGSKPSTVTSSPSNEPGPSREVVAMPRCLHRTAWASLPRDVAELGQHPGALLGMLGQPHALVADQDAGHAAATGAVGQVAGESLAVALVRDVPGVHGAS